jgi:hypothetical protein
MSEPVVNGQSVLDSTRVRAPQFVPASPTSTAVSHDIALEIHDAVIPGELACYAIESAPGAVDLQLSSDCRPIRYDAALLELLRIGAEMKRAGVRLIVAEYPDCEELATYARLLREAGFEIEAAVPDAIADGIALQLAVKRLRPLTA